MGIHIQSWDMDKITYAKVPEAISDTVVKEYKETNQFHNETNGWSKDKTRKQIGEVPFEVMYNYHLLKGDPTTPLNVFFTMNKGKNMKALLNEFKIFRTSAI